MTTFELSTLPKAVASRARSAAKRPVVLTERGRPVAAIVAVDRFGAECLSLGVNPRFLAMLDASRRRAVKEGCLSLDEVRRLLGIPRSTRRRPARAKR